MLRFLPLICANLRRRTARTLFTLLAIAVAFLLYGLLAAVRNGFDANVELAGADRLITMQKVSIVQPLPLAYQSRIASVPGVRLVTHETWFGGRYQNERNILTIYPVPAATFLAMYPEYLLAPAARSRWLRDRTGIIVGRTLASRYGWTVGERIPIRSDIFARADGNYTWDFVIDGIYGNQDASGDLTSLYFHYDYFDEARTAGKGTVGWYVERVDDPKHAAQIAAAIDARFTNSSAETKTGTEKAFVQSFADQTGDIGSIVTAIGIAGVFTMLLVSATPMAQSVRERTGGLSVLKTLGFRDSLVLGLVAGEALVLTLLGGALGLLAAAFAVGNLGTTLHQYLSAFLLTPGAIAKGVGLMIALALAAGALPATRAVRLRIVDGLARR
ncbi:MAG: FtsX-like permease family protein [Steroidobacteraceae bacterium]